MIEWMVWVGGLTLVFCGGLALGCVLNLASEPWDLAEKAEMMFVLLFKGKPIVQFESKHAAEDFKAWHSEAMQREMKIIRKWKVA